MHNNKEDQMNSRVKKPTDSDASKMLEAALQQMDGILLSGSSANQSALSERNLVSTSNVLSTAQTLAMALQQVGSLAPSPDPVTSNIILDWLEAHLPRQDIDERLRRMQVDKESLAQRFMSLTDKVAAQSDKILELERILTEKTQQLNSTESMLQREILARSALETEKLEFMTAISELKFQQAAFERENLELRNNLLNNDPMKLSSIHLNNAYYGSVGSLPKPPVNPPKTPPASFRHQVHPQQFHSLPRAVINTPRKKGSLTDNNANNNKQRNVAFAESEKVLIDDGGGNEMFQSFISQNSTASPSPTQKDKSKGLRNIFGKLRRCNSGNLEDLGGECDLKRGGVRATAAGRIEWTQSPSPMSKSYQEWTVTDICVWLNDLGLGCYEDDCRKWLKNNRSGEFFEVSPVDIAKELNLKSPMHRKKIVLAIAELTGKETDEFALNAGKLDTAWIMRWLDDIGLPQYKDPFLAVKMDGRMLNKLTMEDLSHIHVSSCLHVASLRRAIQVMREKGWNPDCLIRRSKNEENSNEPISLWTAHRVMEWLRVADLAEYAPNLRGAGVHGALMLYEMKFTADLLADLLSIPPSKTLLRRHLATHFKELLGRDVIQAKRDAESAVGYQPLTLTAKIKFQKKSQFSLKRRKSAKGSDLEWSEYVCPIGCTSSDNVNISTSS